MKAILSAIFAAGIIASASAPTVAQAATMQKTVMMTSHSHMHCKMVVTKSMHHGRMVTTRTKKCM